MRGSVSIPAHDVVSAMRNNPEWAAEIICLLSPQTCREIRESEQANCHIYRGKVEALQHDS